jgi:hypothetical protein
MADPEYTRLHITPFNPTLLHVILPPSILPAARNISYHTLQTFPEKAYGYVELPAMDAEKIKKKLHGSILKGTKVRIEAAKPKKEFSPQPEEPVKMKKEKKDSKKRKRGQEAIPAVEIGRSVKRGWTTPGAAIDKKGKEGKKAVVKSKYTTAPECLFKTVLPPNVASKVEKKDGKEKKRRKGDKGTVVHEFEKTTKYATFLRGPAGSKKTKGVAEFVEGKGWVDEDGNVVEEFSKKERKSKVPQKLAVQTEPEESTSADESSEVSSSSEEQSDEEVDAAEVGSSQAPQNLKEDSPTSSSGSSSEEESSSSYSSSEESDALTPTQETTTSKKTTLHQISTSRPQSSSGPPSGLSITIPAASITSTPISNPVHPLEALYKRHRPDSLGNLPKPAASAFSFFGGDEGGDEDVDLEGAESQDQVPSTPFTEKDFEYRGIRSAAPTPDTAYANKRFIWPTDNDDDDDENGDREGSGPTGIEVKGKKGKGEAKEESDFQKWFYENRGETNRAWKKRRREVAKEKRQRENRKRNERAF